VTDQDFNPEYFQALLDCETALPPHLWPIYFEIMRGRRPSEFEQQPTGMPMFATFPRKKNGEFRKLGHKQFVALLDRLVPFFYYYPKVYAVLEELWRREQKQRQADALYNADLKEKRDAIKVVAGVEFENAVAATRFKNYLKS